MIFYHVSPIPGLKTIRPTKEVGGFANFEESIFFKNPKKYACLSTSKEQALYWAKVLSYCRRQDTWFLYRVYVPKKTKVIDLPGRYLFEGYDPAKSEKPAGDVVPHTGEYNIDGEIAIFVSVQTLDCTKIEIETEKIA